MQGINLGLFRRAPSGLTTPSRRLAMYLTATPYMWLGILLAWLFGIVWHIFPIAGAYSFLMLPNLSWSFIGSLLLHWFLPFASLFLVGFGGQAIGMRNLIIYELEADYATYLEALGDAEKTDQKLRLQERNPSSNNRAGAFTGRGRGRRSGNGSRIFIPGDRLPVACRHSESRLLSYPGMFPLYHYWCVARQFYYRYRICHH